MASSHSYDWGPRSPSPSQRRWTAFETDTLLGLICKGVDKTGILRLTRELNKAVNPSGSGPIINLREAEAMLERIEKEKKAAIAFISRQRVGVVTRVQKQVFSRNLDFDGTREEWEAGRKAQVQPREAIGPHNRQQPVPGYAPMHHGEFPPNPYDGESGWLPGNFPAGGRGG